MKLRKTSPKKESKGKLLEKSKKIIKKKSDYKKKKYRSTSNPLKRTKTIAASIKESEEFLNKQDQIEKEKKKKIRSTKGSLRSKSPIPSKKIKKVKKEKSASKMITPKKSVSKSKEKKKNTKDEKSKSKEKKKNIKDEKKNTLAPKPAVVHPPVIVRQPSKLSDTNKNNALKRSESKLGQPGFPTAGIIDAVFCMDTTSSMGSYIQKGQKVIDEIMARIKEKTKGTDIDVKFGFVAYRDHPPQDNTYVTKFMQLDNEDKIKKFISTINANGGGDGPEAVMDGLMDAAKLTKWRDSTTVPQLRYIFHICDAPPHGQEEFGGSSCDWNSGCPCGIKTKDIAHYINMHQIHYRLIKIGFGYLDKMANVFKANFTNYDEQPIDSAHNLEIHVSDMIMRELLPDF